MNNIVERLRAPAYWISGSSEGHEGDNNAPVEAAARIQKLEAALEWIVGTALTEPEAMVEKARAALGEKA